MEMRNFMTFVRGNHDKFGGNLYVIGNIHGLMIGICDIRGNFANIMNKHGDYIMTVETTEEEYDVFKTYIEDHYPGLCIFDYKR